MLLSAGGCGFLLSVVELDKWQRATRRSGSIRTKAVIILGNIVAGLLVARAAFVIYGEAATSGNIESDFLTSEEQFRLMISSVKEYAILMLDPDEYVIRWNAGTEYLRDSCFSILSYPRPTAWRCSKN
jgi:hypothetical protein